MPEEATPMARRDEHLVSRPRADRGLAIRRLRRLRPLLEPVEERHLLSTFVVSTLSDTGPGSLREAIDGVNGSPGPNEIDFTVAGTIFLNNGGLPEVENPVLIDGTTAPGFAGRPVVEVECRQNVGIQF